MSKLNIQTTISPFDQSAVCTRQLLSEEQLDVVISDAVKVQKAWKKTSLDERLQIAEKWVVSGISCEERIIAAWADLYEDRRNSKG